MFLLECFLTVVLSLTWAIFLVSYRVLINDLGVSIAAAGFWTRLVAVFLLFAAIIGRRECREFVRPGRLLKYALLIGAVACGINLCALHAMRYTDASSGSVILKTDILFTLIASHLLLRERMRLSDWAGTLLMAMGTAALLWHKIANMKSSLVGDSLFLLAAVLLTFNAFVIKTKLSEMSNRVMATYNSFVTLAVFSILLLATTGRGDSTPIFRTWPAALMTVVCGVSIASVFLLYYRALDRLPFWLVRVLLLFTPVWTVAIECVFLNKKLLSNEIAGTIVILAGAAVAVLCQNQQARAEVCIGSLGGEKPEGEEACMI